jgi:dehydrogenase/reductase SDR family protein 7
LVWITGASSGIGEELATQLAKQGATLILSARREDELKRVRDGCDNSKKHHIVPLDLCDFASHQNVAQQVFQKIGPVDILIHNAGRSQRCLTRDAILKVDETMLQVNALGTISLTKAVLPFVVTANSPTTNTTTTTTTTKSKKSESKFQIVVVSSLAGKVGAPMSSAYSASKHALHGFFNALRIELAKDVDVTLVCPGPVKSQIGLQAITKDGLPASKVAITPVYDQSKLMKTARCVHLTMVATHCRLMEVWISPNPELLFTYLAQYSPILYGWLAVRLGHMKVVAWANAQHV